MVALSLPLIMLVALFVAVGISVAYGASIGASMEKMAQFLQRAVPLVGNWLAGELIKGEHYVQRKISQFALGFDVAAARWLHGLYLEVSAAGATARGFVDSTAHALTTIVEVAIPRAIGQAERGIIHAIGGTAGSLIRRWTADLRRYMRGIDRLIRDLRHAQGLLHKGIDYIQRVAVRDLARAEHRTEALVHAQGLRIGRHARRLTRLERLVLGGSLVGLILHTLTRYMPWWKCEPWRHFSRKVCSSPLGSLDWLFALTALTSLLLDPRLVLTLGEEAESELDSIIRQMADL